MGSVLAGVRKWRASFGLVVIGVVLLASVGLLLSTLWRVYDLQRAIDRAEAEEDRLKAQMDALTVEAKALKAQGDAMRAFLGEEAPK